jgi:hypothetical protein
MDASSSGPLSELDRELMAALAVEPSADFRARVRMRIAAEPEPASFPLAVRSLGTGGTLGTLTLAAAGIGATAVGLAVVLTQMSVTAVPPDPGLTPPVAAVGPVSPERPTPEMQAVMNSNADANDASRAHLDGRDYVALVTDAETYQKNFSYLEMFWAARHVEGARTISRLGLKAAADLKSAALAKDHAAVAAAIAAIIGTCEACHKRYREQLADNSYAIKL